MHKLALGRLPRSHEAAFSRVILGVTLTQGADAAVADEADASKHVFYSIGGNNCTLPANPSIERGIEQFVQEVEGRVFADLFAECCCAFSGAQMSPRKPSSRRMC